MATYGDGEPTDNALDFYNWLNNSVKEAEGGTGDKALLKVRELSGYFAHTPTHRPGKSVDMSGNSTSARSSCLTHVCLFISTLLMLYTTI